MKCQMRLSMLEEFFDGELDELSASQVAAHLAVCRTCAEHLERLNCEADLYRTYEREVEVTPALWTAIGMQIAEERAAKARRSSAVVAWVGGWLSTLSNATLSCLHPSPALAAVALVLVGASFAVIYRSLPLYDAGDVATRIESSEVNSPTEIKEENGQAVLPVSVENQIDQAALQDTESRMLVVAERNEEKMPVRVNVKAAFASEVATPPDELIESELTYADNLIVDASYETDTQSAEWRKHVEQSQILLRAFRNVRPDRGTASDSPSLDVAYEQNQSRTLLYRNIVLRREATMRGDNQIAKLLDELEPILIDIANLPERPRVGDVQAIKQRIHQKEIVARLQIQTAIGANDLEDYLQ